MASPNAASMTRKRKVPSIITANSGVDNRPSSTPKMTSKVDVQLDFQVEKAIGITSSNCNALSCGLSGDLAYCAGCVVVIFSPKRKAQTQFLRAPNSLKAFSCVKHSTPQGRYLAAGESGHQPAVVVWDLKSGNCAAVLKGHKYGINSVVFSANGKYVVSSGVQHDGLLCIWEWRSGTRLLHQRASSTIHSLAFDTHGESTFVTAGVRQLKFWKVRGGGRGDARTPSTGSLHLDCRAANLGDHQENAFVSVAFAPIPPGHVDGELGPSALYCLTANGRLNYIRPSRTIDKWVDLRVSQAHAVTATDAHVACACANGVVRIFAAHTLAYTTTLPRPAPERQHGITDPALCARLAVANNVAEGGGERYPDAIAAAFSAQGEHLAVVYSDHSLFVWDTRDMRNIGRLSSSLAHSKCIWGIAPAPPSRFLTDQEADECAFATCSYDGSVRLWDLERNSGQGHQREVPCRTASVYCRDLVGVLYADDGDAVAEGGEGGMPATGASGTAGACELRCLAVHPNGRELATGDKSGNVRVYDLAAMRLSAMLLAHDAEVLALDYTEEEAEGGGLLASAGRDRLIHIYDASKSSKPYRLLQTIADHSSSITAVRFANQGARLLSSSADKSILFRHIAPRDDGGCSRYHGEVALRGTVYDLDVDGSDTRAVSVAQDKRINIWNVATGRAVRSYKAEGGEAIAVVIDPGGVVAVCAHTDRCVRMYSIATGELLGKAEGHAEVVTGMSLSADHTRLVTVSGDACIFVWRLPPHLVEKLRAASAEIRRVSAGPSLAQAEGAPSDSAAPSVQGSAWEQVHGDATNATAQCHGIADPAAPPPDNDEEAEAQAREERAAMALEFSLTKLPSWHPEKRSGQGGAPPGARSKAPGESSSRSQRRSRWEERLGREGYTLYSANAREGEAGGQVSVRASGFGQRRRFDLEQSPVQEERTLAAQGGNPLGGALPSGGTWGKPGGGPMDAAAAIEEAADGVLCSDEEADEADEVMYYGPGPSVQGDDSGAGRDDVGGGGRVQGAADIFTVEEEDSVMVEDLEEEVKIEELPAGDPPGGLEGEEAGAEEVLSSSLLAHFGSIGEERPNAGDAEAAPNRVSFSSSFKAQKQAAGVNTEVATDSAKLPAPSFTDNTKAAAPPPALLRAAAPGTTNVASSQLASQPLGAEKLQAEAGNPQSPKEAKMQEMRERLQQLGVRIQPGSPRMSGYAAHSRIGGREGSSSPLKNPQTIEPTVVQTQGPKLAESPLTLPLEPPSLTQETGAVPVPSTSDTLKARAQEEDGREAVSKLTPPQPLVSTPTPSGPSTPRSARRPSWWSKVTEAERSVGAGQQQDHLPPVLSERAESAPSEAPPSPRGKPHSESESPPPPQGSPAADAGAAPTLDPTPTLVPPAMVSAAGTTPLTREASNGDQPALADRSAPPGPSADGAFSHETPMQGGSTEPAQPSSSTISSQGPPPTPSTSTREPHPSTMDTHSHMSASTTAAATLAAPPAALGTVCSANSVEQAGGRREEGERSQADEAEGAPATSDHPAPASRRPKRASSRAPPLPAGAPPPSVTGSEEMYQQQMAWKAQLALRKSQASIAPSPAPPEELQLPAAATQSREEAGEMDPTAESSKESICVEGSKSAVEEEQPCASGIEEEQPCASAVEEEQPCASAVEEEQPCASGIEEEQPCASAVEEEQPCASAVEEEQPCELHTKKADSAEAPNRRGGEGDSCKEDTEGSARGAVEAAQTHPQAAEGEATSRLRDCTRPSEAQVQARAEEPPSREECTTALAELRAAAARACQLLSRACAAKTPGVCVSQMQLQMREVAEELVEVFHGADLGGPAGTPRSGAAQSASPTPHSKEDILALAATTEIPAAVPGVSMHLLEDALDRFSVRFAEKLSAQMVTILKDSR
ncbi:hypothetical protein CYMTET_20160 [Cymbomonas tetramitiformis]|uniref:MABP1/WDR62 second WD40 domain-containing protein n=1 Tax=Cymbomonas tetramitiformis TaxID=36881 RepID=A0AAE0G4M0_9CHLO|nr:hypothetical protein CYMTET_20160 [Cymbomonas tetramitiformis]